MILTVIMGLFDIFTRKNKRDNLTDEDREYGIKVREENREFKKKQMELKIITEELRAKKEQAKLDLEIKKLEQELEDMQEDDEEEIELPEGANPEDAMLVTLLSKVLNQNPSSHNAPVVNSPPLQAPIESQKVTSTGVSLKDEDIKQYLTTVPKTNIKILKKLPDDKLREQIIGVVPNADADSINRIMLQIKAQ